MFFSRLFWKIFGVYAILTVLSAGLFSVVLTQRQSLLSINQTERRLHDSAVLLRQHTLSYFENASPADIQEQLSRLGSQTQTRLTLIAEDGTVLGDSEKSPQNMNNHRDRDELLQARQQGRGISQRPSPTLRIPMMYYALRIGDEENIRGFVRVALTMENVNSQLKSDRNLVWGTAMAAGLVALTLTYFVIGRVIQPLKTLKQAAESIADGELQQQVNINSRDELGTLATAFNSMSDELAKRVQQLQSQSFQLKENSQRLETVLGSMAEGVIAVDSEERILFANRTARTLFDLPADAEDGRPIGELVQNPFIQKSVRQVFAGADQAVMEIELSRTDSIVSLLATQLPGEHGSGVLLVFRDVTELRRLENLRSDFVSNVSHELKTPLTTIQACAETLLDGALDDPGHNRQFVKQIEQQSERLHALILDLLKLAQIESEQAAFEIGPVSVNRAVEKCRQQHQAVAAAKNVSIYVEAEKEDLQVLADAEGVQSILDNLVDNAINYTPAGGSVTIRFHIEENQSVIEVKDTGIGISQEHQDRIFERFYRVDKNRSRELGGTGLGLSIVKHLVQVFKGSIELSSDPGIGSCFTIRLPLA